jgi:RNA polymerase sigma-70 factor (ECF subfamily)
VDLDLLLERCRRGDELAWEALVRRYQGQVYGLAFHYVGNAEEARDLAQEIFLRIYQNLGRFEGGERFVPWMIRIARNLCIDRIRWLKSRRYGSEVPADEVIGLQSSEPGPEEQWAENSRKRQLYSALQTLGEINREIILLKDIQGLSLEEISKLLKIPIGTVKSRSNRARLELARKVLDLSAGCTAGAST